MKMSCIKCTNDAVGGRYYSRSGPLPIGVVRIVVTKHCYYCVAAAKEIKSDSM